MTRKEQIYATIETFLEDNDIGKMTFPRELSSELTDRIAALPLDVPSTIELVNAKRAYPMKKYPYSNISDLMANADRINTAGEGFGEGATWMLDEIIKRNTP